MTPSRKLPGVPALDGGDCPRCKSPIAPGRDRVVFANSVAVHLDCHKAGDKEY